MKHPNMAGFVGHDGDNVWLEPAQTWSDGDSLVLARPDLFVDAEPVKRGPGRPKGSKNKPQSPPDSPVVLMTGSFDESPDPAVDPHMTIHRD